MWHDRNRNGVSEHGEVRPVTAWGIAALSTGYDLDATHPHEIPWSSAGVRFTDGTVRPTFDVMPRRSYGGGLLWVATILGPDQVPVGSGRLRTHHSIWD
ncbi:MAG: hypothetical protein IPL75_09715 [Acidobacteria bacterium]|nr:hypothetical protein [Acidobacteriota bacterium]